MNNHEVRLQALEKANVALRNDVEELKDRLPMSPGPGKYHTTVDPVTLAYVKGLRQGEDNVISARFCIIHDGWSRWYMVPVDRRAEAEDFFESDGYRRHGEYSDPEIVHIENLSKLTFSLPEVK